LRAVCGSRAIPEFPRDGLLFCGGRKVAARNASSEKDRQGVSYYSVGVFGRAAANSDRQSSNTRLPNSTHSESSPTRFARDCCGEHGTRAPVKHRPALRERKASSIPAEPASCRCCPAAPRPWPMSCSFSLAGCFRRPPSLVGLAVMETDDEIDAPDAAAQWRDASRAPPLASVNAAFGAWRQRRWPETQHHRHDQGMGAGPGCRRRCRSVTEWRVPEEQGLERPVIPPAPDLSANELVSTDRN